MYEISPYLVITCGVYSALSQMMSIHKKSTMIRGANPLVSDGVEAMCLFFFIGFPLYYWHLYGWQQTLMFLGSVYVLRTVISVTLLKVFQVDTEILHLIAIFVLPILMIVNVILAWWLQS